MANQIKSANLLTSPSYVETPFIKVTIGQYTFGIYERGKKKISIDELGQIYYAQGVKFPNYIKSLRISTINGIVNTYTLSIEYTVTETDDPNFFEKVFSSVSQTRKIKFSYGDLAYPYVTYKDEEAIITDVQSNFAITASKISYTVSAVSSGSLLNVGSRPYYEPRYRTKPSDVIKDLLRDKSTGLLDVFYGMRNGLTLDGVQLIPDNDMCKNLDAQTNMTVLDYIRYLVGEMTPQDTTGLLKGNIYTLTFSDNISNNLNGPYFQIIQQDVYQDYADAYVIDIGYKSKDVIIDFSIDNNQSYSIFYNYQNQLNPESYVQRYNSRGELESVYAPILSSGNAEYKTREVDKTWWTNVTSFPIKATLTLKGLLRPAMLMSHVRLNVYFYGQKHISSGLYVVSKQENTISEGGFRTVLNLLRIKGEDDLIGTSIMTDQGNRSISNNNVSGSIGGGRIVEMTK